MLAAFTPSYGPANVIEVRDLPRPTPGEREVLVEVRASAVTAADHRLRAADFPSFTALLGRLFIGVLRPRRAVQGTNFSGRVVAVGPGVTRFAVGDEVFGGAMHGAYAEFLVVPEDGAVARKPASLSHDEAAALPYGAVTALHFLRDLAAVKPGERVLVLGASGGVGRFAVQLAKHYGAEVTAVCSAAHFDLARGLGADRVIDHHTTDFTALPDRYDVIFDIAGASSFARSRGSLTEGGRYLSLIVSVGLLLRMLTTSVGRGPRAIFAVADSNRAAVEDVAALASRGVLKPVLARSFPLERIAEAHAARAPGAVTVSMMGSRALA